MSIINSIDNKYNSHLRKAMQEGKTRASLEYEGKVYKFRRIPTAKGWDTIEQLPAPLWGQLIAANICGGGTRDK